MEYVLKFDVSFQGHEDINFVFVPITVSCAFAYAISHCFLLVYEVVNVTVSQFIQTSDIVSIRQIISTDSFFFYLVRLQLTPSFCVSVRIAKKMMASQNHTL